MDSKTIVEIVAAVTIPITVVAFVLHRIIRDYGFGVRSIQFVAIGIFPSVIIILALEGILERSAVGALIGALVGYLFANIGEYDKNKKSSKSSSDPD
jgi:hypothetical protein